LESELLIKAVKQVQKDKDSLAFRYIYDTLSPKLYFLTIRYLKSESEAQDVLQESFVTVFMKIKKYKGNGSFEGWVRRIIVNNCLQRLKKNKKTLISKEIEINEISDSDTSEELELESDNSTLKKELIQAMFKLPDGYRTVLNLYVLEDYTHKEIAQMLNISEGTSRSQLNRAKQALKKIVIAYEA